MSRKHIEMIEKLYKHPVPVNLDWKRLSASLTHFGAEIEVSHRNRALIRLAGQECSISLPHKGHELTTKDEIVRLRRFLEQVGLKPETAAFFKV